MEPRLRKALEARGLPVDAGERDAQDFYAVLDLEEKARLREELGRESNPGEQLSTRSPGPSTLDSRLSTRSIQLRAATIDEEQRSVEAAISTENPVEVWDWKRGELVDEVLLNSGVELPRQLPLLEAHNRWSLDDVLGSIRNLRPEETAIVGRLFFAHDDERADKAWNKVRQGHVTDVSVGYRIYESTTIEPGQTATVASRKFTAGNRAMKIATRWTAKEGSLLAIGADQGSKIREETSPQAQKEGTAMDPYLRKYLESIGLRADASDAEAEKFHAELSGDDRARADELGRGESRDGSPEPSGQRREIPPPLPVGTEPEGQTREDDPPADPAAIARQAVADERCRVSQITELAGDDVPDAVREQALSDGWDQDRASREFLRAIRENRQPQSGGPSIHSHSREGSTTARSLAAGMLISQGLDPTEHSMHNGRRDPLRADRLSEQDADLGDQFSRLSAIDLIRQAAYLDTGRSYLDPEEAMRAATSGASLTLIFTTSAYAKLLQGWVTQGDSTQGWTDEEDVPNFLQQEDITLTAQSRLEQLPRGDVAKHATASDTRETYKIARYAKQFVVDEQDIIDDRLSAIMAMPTEMGEAARRLRPDLVYAIILANPSLVADSTAVFDLSTHANLGTASLGSSSLKVAISGMGKQRLNNNVLNIKPRYLLVPSALEFLADELLSPAMLAKLFADSSDPVFSTENQIARRNLVPVSDDRLGASGVVDPRTGIVTTGSDTGWYLVAPGRRSIRVAFRRGTNRQPSMRSFQLDKGQWGIGWDINLDIGACFIDFRGWYKSSGDA